MKSIRAVTRKQAIRQFQTLQSEKYWLHGTTEWVITLSAKRHHRVVFESYMPREHHTLIKGKMHDTSSTSLNRTLQSTARNHKVKGQTRKDQMVWVWIFFFKKSYDLKMVWFCVSACLHCGDFVSMQCQVNFVADELLSMADGITHIKEKT